MRLLRISAFCVLLIGISGCGSAPIEKAFEGEFSEIENNKVIFDYCQSCHVHRKLIPATHVSEKTGLYQNNKFRETKECRTCHYLKDHFLGDFERKTIRPIRERI